MLGIVLKALQIKIYSVLIFVDMYDSFQAHTHTKQDAMDSCVHKFNHSCLHPILGLGL